jgi:L-2,4-diaminobutyric acid acetyltransferase
MTDHFISDIANAEFIIRNVGPQDVGVLRTLAKASPPLGVHTAYSYWKVAYLHRRHSYIAETREGKAIGFITCETTSDRPDLAFIWQIGVLPEFRRQGVALKLLDTACRNAEKDGIRRFEVTIDPSNAESNGLFQSYCARAGLGISKTDEIVIDDPLSGVREHEVLLEMKRPLNRPSVS